MAKNESERKTKYRWTFGEHTGTAFAHSESDALDEVMELLAFYDIEADRSDVTLTEQ